MGAGEKLRAAALKVAQKVPGADKPVTLMQDLLPSYDPATDRRPSPIPTTLVSFGQACEVRNLSVQRAEALLGGYEAGDREFLLPAASVTEAQLRTAGAYLIYGDERLNIERVDAHEGATFGVVATWRVIGRARGATA